MFVHSLGRRPQSVEGGSGAGEFGSWASHNRGAALVARCESRIAVGPQAVAQHAHARCVSEVFLCS